MKHMNRFRIFATILAILIGTGTLLTLPTQAADEKNDDSKNNEYEAKKAAYREKLKSNDVTTDDFLIGSWVSFYSFDIHSYEYQLDQMAEAGINFNIFPKNFGGGSMRNAEYWNDVEAQYAKRNMVYLMNGSRSESNVALGSEFARGKEHCIGYHLIDEPPETHLSRLDISHSFTARQTPLATPSPIFSQATRERNALAARTMSTCPTT